MSWFRPQRGVQRPGLWVSSFPAQPPPTPHSQTALKVMPSAQLDAGTPFKQGSQGTQEVYIVWKQKQVARTAVALLQHNWPHAPLPHTQKEVDWASWAPRQKPPGQFSLPTGFLSEETNYLLPFSTFIERYVKPWQDDMKIDRPLVMFLALSLHGDLGIFKINLTWRRWRTWATVDFWENTSVN